MTDITPSPPQWKSEEIQKLNNLISRYEDLSKIDPNRTMRIQNLPWGDEKNREIRATPEYKIAYDRYLLSRRKLSRSIRNALLSTNDYKSLSDWLSSYIDLYVQSHEEKKHNYLPDIFEIDVFPQEFWDKLDYDVSKKVYRHLITNEGYRAEQIDQYFPGLSNYK
jgi:hypothetical protein